MKIILVAMIVMAAAGCSSTRPLQMEMVRAELIRIDTVFRERNEKQLLTWRSQDNIEYVTYIPMSQTYLVGSSVLVMRTR